MIIIDSSEIVGFRNSLKKKKGKQYEMVLRNIEELSRIGKIMDIKVDYIVYGKKMGYVLERKTISDLYGSIVSGRLWKQLDGVKEVVSEMKEKTGIEMKPGIIIEGNQYLASKMIKRKITDDFLNGVQIGLSNMGIAIFRTASVRGTINLLKKMDEKLGKSKNTVVVVRRKELNKVDDERLVMLLGINGIGGVKAKKLLEKYGSIRNIINAPDDEIIEILGAKLGNHFLEVIK